MDALSTTGHDGLVVVGLSATVHDIGNPYCQDSLGKFLLLYQLLADLSYTVLTGGLVPLLLKTGGSSLCYTPP